MKNRVSCMKCGYLLKSGSDNSFFAKTPHSSQEVFNLLTYSLFGV